MNRSIRNERRGGGHWPSAPATIDHAVTIGRAVVCADATARPNRDFPEKGHLMAYKAGSDLIKNAYNVSAR